MTVGGLVWLTYSYAYLPRGPHPAVAPHDRRWVATRRIAATGCDGIAATTSGDDPAAAETAARLERLEHLRTEGLLGEIEYQQRRQALGAPADEDAASR